MAHQHRRRLLVNLTQARTLHDRDEDDPTHCLTCRDDNGDSTPWPCPTATALGATGRSEWTTPDNTGHPDEPCTRGCPHNTMTTATIITVCGARRPTANPHTTYICVRTPDHTDDGAHRDHMDRDGDTW
jgi:hypothetical protein